MGADEVAAIRPALLELEAALAELREPGSGPLCASFEVEPPSGPWVQVVFGSPDTLNLWCPPAAAPHDRLTRLSRPAPPDLALVAHEPGSYATFSFARPAPMELARFIDAVFVEFLGCSSKGYPVTVSLLRLPDEDVTP